MYAYETIKDHINTRMHDQTQQKYIEYHNFVCTYVASKNCQHYAYTSNYMNLQQLQLEFLKFVSFSTLPIMEYSTNNVIIYYLILENQPYCHTIFEKNRLNIWQFEYVTGFEKICLPCTQQDTLFFIKQYCTR